MVEPAQWIKKNMLGDYSEQLGRPLTEPEVRVQRSLERLQIPDWYQKYSRPPCKILKNATPFECRPASWKTIRVKNSNSPRKTPKKRSPKNTPKKSRAEDSPTSTVDSGFAEKYRVARKTPRKERKSSVSTSSCSSATESDGLRTDDENSVSPWRTLDRMHKSCFSFPPINRLRKFENLNNRDLFNTDPPVDPSSPSIIDMTPSSPRKTFYTMTKNLELNQAIDLSLVSEASSVSNHPHESSHASFLIADVEPNGVTTRLCMHASLVEPDESADKLPAQAAPSPSTRFFKSNKKSTALEKIVQSRRSDTGGRNHVQEIIGELDRSSRGLNGGAMPPLSDSSNSFVRSMVSALEQSYRFPEDEEDRRSSSSDDSELAKSTSISFKSYDSCSSDERLAQMPLPELTLCSEVESEVPQEEEEEEVEEEEVYWVPCKIRELSRSSTRMSFLSAKGSPARLSLEAVNKISLSEGRNNSPGLSPIRRERRDEWLQRQQQDWGATYGHGKSYSRQLFRIDETGFADSGYSDRSGVTSSRTATLSSDGETCRRSSPSSSISSSPTLTDCESITSNVILTKSAPYVLKSFMV